MSAQIPRNAEDEFDEKLDHCIADMIVKSSRGLAIGAVLSLVLFKKKAWPIVMGTGFGIGVAYRKCEKDLNNYHKPKKFQI